MGISYIPGPEAILGPAAKQIGAAIAQMMDPNKQFREGMRNALATNPALIGQLADVEALAPGTLANMGFGNLGDIITKTPQSAESEFAQENKGKIKKGAQTKLEADTKTSQLTLEKGAAILDLMRNNKQMTYEMAARELTGETETDRLKRPAAKLAGEQAKLSLEALRDVDIKELGKIDMISKARAWMRNEVPTSELVKILSVPQSNQAWNDALDYVMQEKRMAHDKLMQSMRDDPMNGSTFLDQKAFQMFDQSNAGSPAVWKDYMYGNGGKGRKTEAAELSKKNPSTLTPEQRDLVEVYNADKQMQFASTRNAVSGYNIGLSRAIEDFQKSFDAGMPDPLLQSKISGINNMLDVKAGVTGQQVSARYGEIPGSDEGWTKFGTDGLYFVDKDGNSVDLSVVLSDFTPDTPFQEDVKNRVAIEGMKAHYSKLSLGEQQAQLGVWEAGNPELYLQFIKSMGIKSDTVGPKKLPPVTIR